MATEAASLDSAPHAVISADVSSRTLCCRLPLLSLLLLLLLLLSPASLLLLLSAPLLLAPLLLPPPSSRSRLPVKRCRDTPSAACFSSS